MVESRLGQMLREKGSLLDAYTATGIHPSQLSRYAAGLTMPRYDTALRLAPYLGITVERLLALCYAARRERQQREARSA